MRFGLGAGMPGLHLEGWVGFEPMTPGLKPELYG
jgi:hypothetical protein